MKQEVTIGRRWRPKLVARYRKVVEELERYKGDRFYHGTKVMVKCLRFTGWGTAVTDHQCPLDKVAVLLENGNVWWYNMEDVQPVKL